MEKLIEKLEEQQKQNKKFEKETDLTNKNGRERLMYYRGKKNQLASVLQLLKKL